MAKNQKASAKRKRSRKQHRPRRTPHLGSVPRDGLVPGFTNDERLALESIFADLLRRAARELRPALDPLDAQRWASAVWGVWYGRHLVDQDAEAVFGGGLIAHAARTHARAAVRALRALTAVAPAPYADEARRAADRLVAAGVADAPWAGAVAADVRAVDAALHEDPVDDDGVSVMVGFDGATGPHTLMLYVDRNTGGTVKDALLAPAALDDFVSRVRAVAPSEIRENTVIRPLELDEAAARWREGIEMTDMTLDPPMSDEARSLRALALARLRAMPQGGTVPEPRVPDEREREEIVRTFAASPFAAELHGRSTDPDEVEDLAFQCLCYACDYAGGVPLRFSPVMVELFCCDWAPRKIAAEAEAFALLPDVLRAWIRFCGERRGIPRVRVEEAVVGVSTYEAELLEASADPRNWGPAKALVQAMRKHGIDPADRQGVDAFIERVNAGDVDVIL